MEVKLGGGAEARLWDGLWSGNRMLKDVHPRLFQLSLNKDGRVSDMGSWEGEEWQWKLK